MTSRSVELEVTLDDSGVDAALDALWAGAPTAIEERRSGPSRTTLVAGFAVRGEADAMAVALAGLCRSADVALHITELADQSFLDAWREHAGPVRAGRFLIVPSWLDDPPADGAGIESTATTIRLDPGPAFGSGSHPTTRLVLRAVDRLVTAHQTVLDVGCGSGVLAIAAAVRGASVVAIDVDAAAVSATLTNAEANEVADRVTVSDQPLASLAGSFDVVLANLLAPTIEELAGALVARVAQGGRLVLSGLLADRWSATTDLFTGWLVEVEELEGWVAATLVRHRS